MDVVFAVWFRHSAMGTDRHHCSYTENSKAPIVSTFWANRQQFQSSSLLSAIIMNILFRNGLVQTAIDIDINFFTP